MGNIVLKAVLSLCVSYVTLLVKINVFCHVLAHITVCNLPKTIYKLPQKIETAYVFLIELSEIHPTLVVG